MRRGLSSCGAISGDSRPGFARRGDLQTQRRWIDVGVIVRQQVERHRRYLRQQFVERRRITGRGDVVAMPPPDRVFIVPDGGNGKDDLLRHIAPPRPAGPRRGVA